MDDLAHQGLILRKQGRGTFVSRSGALRQIGFVIPGAFGYELFPPILTTLARLSRENGYAISFRDLRVPGGHRVTATLVPGGRIFGSVTGFSDGSLTLVLPSGRRLNLTHRKGAPVSFSSDAADELLMRG